MGSLSVGWWGAGSVGRGLGDLTVWVPVLRRGGSFDQSGNYLEGQVLFLSPMRLLASDLTRTERITVCPAVEMCS